MEKIKAGEFVRTKDGYIGKCQKIDVYYGDILIRTELKRIIYDFEVVKHSFNIIDLIEEGDYVNGYRVKEVGIYKEKDVVDIYAFCSNLNEIEHKLINKKWYILDNMDLLPGRNCKNDSIKSIITKEQFKAMEYMIKEV